VGGSDAKRAVDDRLRAVVQAAESPGRTVAAFNEAATAVVARWREWFAESLRANWRTSQRMELAERRAAAASRPELQPVLTPRAKNAIRERRQQLQDDAKKVQCPQSVLIRAWLLEEETTRAAASSRRGRRAAPITVEESLRVWILRKRHELKYRQIDRVYGIEERRALRIMRYLEPDSTPDDPQ
jgi:hypothetical protein